MHGLDYVYAPVEEKIRYLHVCRSEDFSRDSIHMHDHHELVLVTGETEFELVNNGNALQASGPCLILNRAGSFHEVVRVCGGDYESHVLFFHPLLLQDLPEELCFREALLSSELTLIPLEKTPLARLLTLFLLLKEAEPFVQKSLLLALLGETANCLRLGKAVRKSASHSYIFEVIEALSAMQPLTLSQLAERFHVSPTKLKNDFKRLTGMPVMAYRNRLRLERARLLLESTEEPQARIAYQCGFTDESYFIRAFRKHYGTTPADHRHLSFEQDLLSFEKESRQRKLHPKEK